MKKRLCVLFSLPVAAACPVIALADDGTTTTMAEALFNTVLGIGTVFLMLIVMCVIIYAFRIIPKLQAGFGKKKTVEQPKAAPQSRPAPVEDVSDDLELVAVIAAAIAASEQVPIDSFRVRTIKRRH